MYRWRRDTEESLQIRFRRRSPVDHGVVVDERQILTLFICDRPCRPDHQSPDRTCGSTAAISRPLQPIVQTSHISPLASVLANASTVSLTFRAAPSASRPEIST